VRAARQGIGAGETDTTRILLREAQLLLGYPDSPIVGGEHTAEPRPGMRAPDAAGLRQDPLGSLRCHELFRHPGHTLLVWAASPDAVPAALELVDAVQRRTAAQVRGYVVTPGAGQCSGRVLADADGNLAAAYGFTETGISPAVCLVRPDGYISFRSAAAHIDELIDHISLTLRLD
jgi:hypothetical protein